MGPLDELAVDLGGYLLEPLDDPAPLASALEGEGMTVTTHDQHLLVDGATDLASILEAARATGVVLRAARPHTRGVHDVVVDLMEGRT